MAGGRMQGMPAAGGMALLVSRFRSLLRTYTEQVIFSRRRLKRRVPLTGRVVPDAFIQPGLLVVGQVLEPNTAPLDDGGAELNLICHFNFGDNQGIKFIRPVVQAAVIIQ